MEVKNKIVDSESRIEPHDSTIALSAIEVLNQLRGVLVELKEIDFVRPVPVLHGATFGQHVRHVLDFFVCLQKGWETGTVNYDRRERSHELENSLPASLMKIESIIDFIRIVHVQQSVVVAVNFCDDEVETEIQSNFARELVYNLEHAVHHMALIKIGLSMLCPYLKVPESFGVARSTLKHQQSGKGTEDVQSR